MSELLQELSQAVIAGDREACTELTEDLLDDGLYAQQILNEGLMPGMEYVGREFRAGAMFVPEVLRSARAMQASMDTLKPLLVASGVPMMGKVLLGTVHGDMHDIGKNLVGMMCEGAGFEVIDLGKNATPDDFVRAVQETKPDVVGMSALLTTTMRAMERTIDAFKVAGIREQVKVMVGGAPVTKEFAIKIGADGYANNAASAVDLAKSFVVE